MFGVVVEPVINRRQWKQFLGLPWAIYQDDPFWIPPLRRNQEELVGYRRHPFYEQAESQAFLAYRNGEPCGRVLALINRAHNLRHEESRGFFGFFESRDDSEVAAALFESVKNWLSQRGVEAIRGPTNPSLNYECGLLVEGFDSSPTFMMTYNPPYYGRLIEENGFQKVQDLYAYWGHVDMVGSLDKKLQFVIDEAKRRFDVKLRRLDRSRFRTEVRMFLDIYNQSLGGTWGFVPLSDAEIDHMSSGMRHLIVPEMTSVAEVDGRPVAAIFGLLDYNPRIREIDGRLFPLGFLRLLNRRKSLQTVRLISTNVIPEFQRWGIGLVVLNRLLPDILDWGIQEVEFSWVLESNHLSRATLERGGAIRTKTYRLYDYEFESEVVDQQPVTEDA